MQIKHTLYIVGACALILSATSALAQGSGNGPGNGTNTCTGINNYAYSNHWSYAGSGSGPWYSDLSRWSNAPAPRVWTNSSRAVARYGNGGTPAPAQVQAMVKQFQTDREAFVARQSALKQQLAGASEGDRQRLRDQLRDQMQTWKEQQSRLRDQLKDQGDRLRDQVRDHDRLLDRASNPGTGSSQGSSGSAGTRARGR